MSCKSCNKRALRVPLGRRSHNDHHYHHRDGDTKRVTWKSFVKLQVSGNLLGESGAATLIGQAGGRNQSSTRASPGPAGLVRAGGLSLRVLLVATGNLRPI